MQIDTKRNLLFPNPFSAEYWKVAAAQLKSPRMLCYAAMMIAVRVAMKKLAIPVGPELDIQFAFLVNALGAMTFGPVVAVIAAAVSDTLGCALEGFAGYFFPFIFVEIVGSLIFALWLWRAKISTARVILSRFSVVAVCNFIMNPAVMNWYYAWLNNGKSFKYITVFRVVKNTTMFPIESILLVLFLGVLIRPLQKLGFLSSALEPPKLEKKHLLLLAVLFALSVVFVVLYYFVYLPSRG